MLFRIGDNVAVTCKNPNETLLFINRVPTAWLFSIDIEICQKVKRMIVEEQNLKDIKIEYESEDCTTGRVVDLPMAEYVQIYYRTIFILSANKLIVNCFYTELLLLDTYIYVKTNFLYIIEF